MASTRQIQRIKDARLARIPAANRPHYTPEERFEILSLRAAASWSVATTARVFQIAAGTIVTWARRLDEGGPAALLALPAPVNKLPECHSLVVEQLRALLPTMGKRRIAQLLTRAGVSLAASTVKRIQDRKRRPKPPNPPAPASPPVAPERPRYPGIRAKRSHHVWHVDLTLVPPVGRFFCVWFPFSVPQCWPFYWWVAAVLDQHSGAVMAKGVFKTQPSAEQVCRMLDRAVRRAGCGPTHIISDQGGQFREEYRAWCRKVGAKPRFGAVGKREHRLARTLLAPDFGTLRLLSWYREGADVEAKLPVLSTYLGHASVGATQRYLTILPETQQLASERFHLYGSSLISVEGGRHELT